MEKTITLTSDEISSITLAIYDKVMNLSQTVLICGAELTPNAQQRIETLKAIALKLMVQNIKDRRIGYGSKRDHKEVCNAFANLRQALGDSRMLDSLYQFIDTYKLADYVELIARDEDIYLSYDGEVDETRPYNDEDEEEEEE